VSGTRVTSNCDRVHLIESARSAKGRVIVAILSLLNRAAEESLASFQAFLSFS
jgi:hypothetical protein